MLPPDCAPSSIPEDAEEVLTVVGPDDQFFMYDCIFNGEIVGKRNRLADGTLAHEMGWRGDRPHGWCRRWDEPHNPDQLLSEVFMIEGREHGVARQWQDGKLIGWYIMDCGSGVDLWRGAEGELSEERYCNDGKYHGYERWWWSHPSNITIWWERHFHENREHGIERDWNDKGRIRRGYPRYYVHGERVTKRQYLSAAKKDATLPPYRPEDDRPERPLPPEYFQTMPPAVPPVMPENPEAWRP